jgi:hypothetical protein
VIELAISKYSIQINLLVKYAHVPTQNDCTVQLIALDQQRLEFAACSKYERAIIYKMFFGQVIFPPGQNSPLPPSVCLWTVENLHVFNRKLHYAAKIMAQTAI